MMRAFAAELPRLLVRLALALILYDLALRVPWPAEMAQWVALGAAGLLTATILIIFGKFLYDTLFFDRYWRQMDNR